MKKEKGKKRKRARGGGGGGGVGAGGGSVPPSRNMGIETNRIFDPKIMETATDFHSQKHLPGTSSCTQQIALLLSKQCLLGAMARLAVVWQD